MWVSFVKKQHFEQNDEKNHFFEKNHFDIFVFQKQAILTPKASLN